MVLLIIHSSPSKKSKNISNFVMRTSWYKIFFWRSQVFDASGSKYFQNQAFNKVNGGQSNTGWSIWAEVEPNIICPFGKLFKNLTNIHFPVQALCYKFFCIFKSPQLQVFDSWLIRVFYYVAESTLKTLCSQQYSHSTIDSLKTNPRFHHPPISHQVCKQEN